MTKTPENDKMKVIEQIKNTIETSERGEVMISVLQAEFNKGWYKGVAEGEAEGEAKATRSLILNMLKQNADSKFISVVTGYTDEQIEEISKGE